MKRRLGGVGPRVALAWVAAYVAAGALGLGLRHLGPPVSARGRAAAEVLRTAPSFESADLGISGTPSQLVAAWRVVERERGADSVFRSLLRTATPAGQLYALAGLYTTDRSAFEAEVEPYLASGDSVRAGIGCVFGRIGVAELAAGIASGEWPRDFREPAWARLVRWHARLLAPPT